MKIPKQLIVTGVVATIGAVGAGQMVSAQTATGDGGSDTLVAKIAQKFNLDSSEVQQVFDQDRQAKEAEREAKIDSKLAQLVTDGKITNEQKDAIVAKRSELKAERDSNMNAMDSKTGAERKAEMDAKKTELENWAKQNNISTEYLRYVMGGGRGHGPGGPGFEKINDTNNSSNADDQNGN
jgi:hypothetical protein